MACVSPTPRVAVLEGTSGHPLLGTEITPPCPAPPWHVRCAQHSARNQCSNTLQGPTGNRNTAERLGHIIEDGRNSKTVEPSCASFGLLSDKEKRLCRDRSPGSLSQQVTTAKWLPLPPSLHCGVHCPQRPLSPSRRLASSDEDQTHGLLLEHFEKPEAPQRPGGPYSEVLTVSQSSPQISDDHEQVYGERGLKGPCCPAGSCLLSPQDLPWPWLCKEMVIGSLWKTAEAA